MNNWRSLKIREFAITQSGGTPSTTRSDYWDGDIPWINSGELKDCSIKKASKYITKLGLESSSARLFPKNTVVIALTGATTSKLGLLEIETSTNQSVTGILPNSDFNSKFLFYQLLSLRREILSNSLGTAQPHINKRIVDDIIVKLPPLTEQLAIVSKIEELFSDLENGKQQLQLAQQQLKVYRQSLLKAAFEGKLTEEWRNRQIKLLTGQQIFNKVDNERSKLAKLNKIKIKPIQNISIEELTELPELPGEYFWTRLGNILWSVKDGPHYSPKYQDNGIPFISGGNIRPSGIDFENVKFISKELHEELSKRCKPEKWDVLYTKGGTTGIARVNNYDLDFNVWVHVAVLKKVSSVNPYYLQHVLNSNHCYKQAQKYTHGVGNQDLGLTRLILITLPICSIEEQNEIVYELETRFTICDKIEETINRNLQQAEILRQSILKKAFEGKLV